MALMVPERIFLSAVAVGVVGGHHGGEDNVPGSHTDRCDHGRAQPRSNVSGKSSNLDRFSRPVDHWISPAGRPLVKTFK